MKYQRHSELKGWYLLAKEGEPSFRFRVTPEACALQDLIVVVPWVLNNVISGSPRVVKPYIESARYAAEFRNYHWSEVRESKDSREIKHPEQVKPYPSKSDNISDVPEYDRGNNFGRYARTGLMDNYLTLMRSELLCGIPAEYWLGFFKIFKDQSKESDIKNEIEKLKKKINAISVSQPIGSPLLSILDQLELIAESYSETE